MGGVGRTTGAFTLVELVLVLAVMAVLAAVAAPRYASSANNYRAKLAAQRLVSDLALARAAAKASSSSRTVLFDSDRGLVVLSGVGALDGATGSYTLRLHVEPYRAAMGKVQFGDAVEDDQLVFDGYGVPDSGLTVTISTGSSQRIVVLDAATGVAQVQ